MPNIKEQLIDIAWTTKLETYKLIASKLILSYDQINTPTITKLATDCNVVKSVITKFAQSLGFEGYVELQYSIKIEKQNYRQFNISGKDINQSESFNSVKNYIIDYINYFDQYENNIHNIAELLLSSKYTDRHIFSDSNSKEVGYAFSQALNIKNVTNFYFSSKIYEAMQLRNVKENDLVICLFSNSINDEFHFNLYEVIKKKCKNLILFVDSDKSQKYDSFIEKIVTDRNTQERGNVLYHQSMVQYVFLQIVHDIRCLINLKKHIHD